MNRAVTAVELAKKVIEALGLKAGDPIELARLRNGGVLLRRLDESKPDESGKVMREG